MTKVRPCGKSGCAYPALGARRTCLWHWLLRQPADVQASYASQRAYLASMHRDPRATVPKREWPAGERWCAGCQDFVPLFYCTGSRCKACASSAAHEARVQKVYGLEPGEYEKLFRLQGGRCYICGRRSPSRRLAVDHDHETNEPRGLLCPDLERGCNHKVIGLLDANSVDGGLAAAKRLVDYLEDSPYARMRRGEAQRLRVATPVGDDIPAPF